MKTISKLALALALTTGVSSLAITASPAAAAKKEEKKGGLKLSPEALKPAQAAQTALAARDVATAEPQVVALEAAAKTDDDKYIAAALRYQLEQTKIIAGQQANPNAPINEAVLAAPLDALIANPSTPAEDRGKYAYRRGALAYNGKQYPVAIQYFEQAQKLGYVNEDMGLQIAQAKVASGNVTGGLSDLKAAIDAQTQAGKKAPEDYYRYGIAQSNKAGQKQVATQWMLDYVKAYPTSKTWRDVIVTYGIGQGSIATLDKPQKIDLFRLMRATGSLADQYDYEEYSQALADRGLPQESNAVIKEGIASGKVPAANALAKELLANSAKGIQLEGSLTTSENKAKAAASGDIAAQTGDAYLGTGNYAKAIEMYQLALQKGGAKVNADEVNTHLGIAQARAGDKTAATASFAKVTTQPRAGIAQLWTTYLQAPPAAGGAAPAAAPAG
ncbi:hypothetical protein GGQ80_002141 [Sphingomonas jinjuensis]|uniref:Tetratricopeptide repeat protein n=1 Tax=Sphingomonas jinjuensis TaxID=535907 RepID=A0A840FC00_9SPHN|nr:hypothetical protein [Sphingomonas jinjuensis]MBB4154231.1 hypothetical protein [Sphingomonas jinjuensis]